MVRAHCAVRSLSPVPQNLAVLLHSPTSGRVVPIRLAMGCNPTQSWGSVFLVGALLVSTGGAIDQTTQPAPAPAPLPAPAPSHSSAPTWADAVPRLAEAVRG